MNYKELIESLKKTATKQPKSQGHFYSWNSIKNHILKKPGKVSWQTCKKLCDDDDECSAWERCTPSRYCAGCYLFKDHYEKPVYTKNRSEYAEAKPKWREIKNMNYGYDKIKQGTNTKDWIYFNKHQNAQSCANQAYRNKKETNNDYHSVVYFDANYKTEAFRKECYGLLNSGKSSKRSEKNVTTMIPPNGTTSFGGLSTETTFKRLQRINMLMEEKIKELNKIVLNLYKAGLYNEEKLKTTKKELNDEIHNVYKERNEVKRMLHEHFGKTGEFFQSFTEVKMSKYKLYAFLLLLVVVVFATFRIMKSTTSVSIPKFNIFRKSGTSGSVGASGPVTAPSVSGI